MTAPFELAFDDAEEFVDDSDELDLGALPHQPAKSKPGTGASVDFKRLDEAALRDLIETGQSYYNAASELAWRWARDGAPADQTEDNLRGLFDTAPPQLQQDKKWRKGRAAILTGIAAYLRALDGEGGEAGGSHDV